MERKGERVGALEKFNVLFTSLQINQRGCTSAVEKGFVGSSMKTTMEANKEKLASQLSQTLKQVHTETSLSASHLAAQLC